MSAAGASLFARYAYPPNELGYCGPDDHEALLAYASGDRVDNGLVDLARRFDGAWPYLEMIADALGIDDPLDGRVVEAYWLGNASSRRVLAADFDARLGDRFAERAGTAWSDVSAAIEAGGAPTHAFQVFSVYPWVELLRSGVVEESLRVLDRCRIRWGRLLGVDGDHATVRSRPVEWADGRLVLGAPQEEEVRLALEGAALLRGWAPGDWLALHWDWACDTLDRRRLAGLRSATYRQLELVNRSARPRPAAPVT